MRRCDKVILVEGKYDKVRLESFLDATVLTTDGFGIFKDREKKALIRSLAATRGIVVLTDPDGAGKLIRSHIRTVTGGKGVTELFVPPVPGKEKRKKNPSKEGVLGVEGLDNQTLLSLFSRAGLLADENTPPRKERYSRFDLYNLGLFGKENSAEKRLRLLERFSLPRNLSSTAFLEAVNLLGLDLEKE